MNSEPRQMNPAISIQNSLPDDITLKIASSLQVLDVCSLGSCSRFWRELCGSNFVWEALCRDRWPAMVFDDTTENQSHDTDQEMDPNLQGCRALYINKHNEMAEKAVLVTNYLCRTSSGYESIEVGHYLKAIQMLESQQLGFKDVEMFLMKPNLHVLVNLVGLHYCIISLCVPVQCVFEALTMNGIAERQFCVRWWKLGRWFNGFRLRDDSHSQNVSLGDLVLRNEQVLGVLKRGAVHEVLRVQISAAKEAHTSWSFQVIQNLSA